tara:strand:+ start:771 stop:1040 length:270 start_codon:yes stop_codon:yes gene_type:complete
MVKYNPILGEIARIIEKINLNYYPLRVGYDISIVDGEYYMAGVLTWHDGDGNVSVLDEMKTIHLKVFLNSLKELLSNLEKVLGKEKTDV